MNRNATEVKAAVAAPVLKKLLMGALLGAALCSMSLAQAATKTTTLKFEGDNTNSFFGQFDDGNYYSEQGYTAVALSPFVTETPTFVGQLIDGSDSGAGNNQLALPTNNSSTYYGAFNDSILSISADNGSSFRLAGLDASFIGYSSAASYPSTAGFMGFEALLSDGTYYSDYFALPAFSNGAFSFNTYTTSGALAQLDMVELSFYTYACSSSGSCTAFGSNQGQFAIDNLVLTSTVSAVPEPSTYAMMLLGLAGVGAVARRRNRQA